MDEIKRKAPAGWSDALERAEANVADGRVSSGSAARQRLRDSIKQMQAQDKNKSAQNS